MHNFNDLIEQSLERLKTFDPESVVDDFSGNILPIQVGLGDVRNKVGSGYYAWFPGFIELLNPGQVVELGGAMGVADIMILKTLPLDSRLWSITLEENGKEFCFIKKDYPNFVPVVGDDLDLNSWPKSLDLSLTDLWFIDSEHSERQLRAELELYKQFFKSGAVVLFDDIHLNPGMQNVWDDLETIFPVAEKKDLTNPLHWSGYGVIKIK